MRTVPQRVLIGAVTLASLSGCYVVPVAPEAAVVYPVVAPPVVAAPVALTARLYPANEVAAQHGAITGTVTNLLTGRGHFQLEYQGEWLVGEASRVQGDERRGIANAFGPRGTYMGCDYQMRSASQGTGSCTLSNGARYSVHLGN